MRKYYITIAIFLAMALSCHATTRTAATCSTADVQTQINLSATNDTVIIPAGSCTYSAQLTTTVAITLQCNPGANIALSSAEFVNFDYHISGGVERVSGCAFTGTPAAWTIVVQGKPTSFRVDHNTFTNLAHRFTLVGGQNDSLPPCYPIYGVIDHNTWTQNTGIPGVTITGCNEAWRSANTTGTANNVIVEDNSFSYTGGGYTSNAVAIDCEHGGQFIARHNTISNTWIGHHDTGSTASSRSCRNSEIYSNTMTCAKGGGGGCGNASDLRGSMMYFYNNSITMDVAGNGTIGFNPGIATEIYRTSFTGGEPWNFSAGANTHKVCDLTFESIRIYDSVTFGVCFSVGTGNCVDSCTVNTDCGSGSGAGKCLTNIDGGGTGGYPVRDQTGVSADANDAASTQTAAADPVAIWGNTDPNNSNALITGVVSVAGANASYIVINREYYEQPTSFTGATGVGNNTLASRPATCTTGVFYWESDNNQLDKCTSTNTWTNAVYVPYVYPSPLQGTTAPAAAPTMFARVKFSGKMTR